MANPPLTSPRLRFEALSRHHAPLVFALFNDPAFIRYVGDRGIRTVEDAVAQIEGPLARQQRPYATKYAVYDGDKPIGLCGLMQRDYLPAPDLGYSFLAEARGRGLAREAARWVLYNCALATVYAMVNQHNQPSRALLEDMGFAVTPVGKIQIPFIDTLLYVKKTGSV
ncbi:GNAT family N-acetyltransferase [Simiduia agarivorans]|uniref:GCN5-related N-acetyltransferase n=1 Tax=Simiduia agarivorans (strain DSM 21679 / JCM 13881 / BCRC 17597 / SA1) TaxID=1117647 RepID=K4KH80_SIMAS|nr:GNAT family N-acetyltransferase [Simiduia agarivorans]AFU98464.1 GCN5-related N-acetyltransferase [Simiduia agarivorans SA1 = DSM 21679]